MQGIKQLYRIGYGPSSSHTIAPYRIVSLYKENILNCNKYEIELGGSLALTAKGHGTIDIIKKALNCNDVSIKCNLDIKENVLNITGYINNEKQQTWHSISTGGGAIKIKEYATDDELETYKENNFSEIKKYLKEHNCSLLEYVYSHEPNLKSYLLECLNVMFETVNKGFTVPGVQKKLSICLEKGKGLRLTLVGNEAYIRA